MGEEALTLSKDLPWFHAPAAKNIGHAYLALGQLQKAKQNYLQAVELYRAYQQTHLIPEPLAGLAQIALLEGEPEQAFAFIQPFLPAILEGSPQGPDRLMWVYLACHQALIANEDPSASEVIHTGRQILIQRAATITDEKRRQSYLTGIGEHREIARTWQLHSKND